MGLGGGPLNTWAGFLWHNSVRSKEGCVGVFFWGCFQEFVYKVCVCLKGECVSVQAVCLGHLFLTPRMLCGCVACACICVCICVGVAGHLRVFVYMPVCACVPVSL